MLTNSRYNHTTFACGMPARNRKAIFAAKQYIDAIFDYRGCVGMFR
jgi:hypothetical protein